MAVSPPITLRDLLQSKDPLLCPGVFDAFSATLADRAGSRALYLSGASIAYTRLGAPDIGLVAMTEVADTIARIRECTALPLIVDADTGFGNAVNVQRTVRVFERAGASALQLEDQNLPKRCGHLGGKSLVSTGEMVGKIKAAIEARESALVIARTDAIAVEGFASALDRAEAYLAAGADILFVEAPQDLEQLRMVGQRFGHRVPLLANMVEGGRTPLLPASELAALGFRVLIYPGGAVRALAHTLRDFYASLHTHGGTMPFHGRMLSFKELNDLLETDVILQRASRFDETAMQSTDPVSVVHL